MANLKRNMELNQLLKESVRLGLIQLMKNNDYNKINITDICIKAGVSRAGFYRNYKTKDDVIKEISHDFVLELMQKTGGYFESTNKHSWYMSYFKYLLDSKEIVTTLYNAGFSNAHLIETNKYLINLHDNLSNEEIYRRLAFNGALHNVSIFWLFNSPTSDIKIVADYCCKFIC